MATRAKKTARETAKPAKRPQPNGRGALYVGGVPGNKGGTGRPPAEHVAWCQQMVSDPNCEGEVAAVLRDRRHPAFATMWKAVSERAYGKPAQAVTVTGADGGPISVTITRRIVRPPAKGAA